MSGFHNKTETLTKNEAHLKRVASLLKDNVVQLALSNCDLQNALEWFAAECEVVKIRMSTSKYKAMVLCRVSITKYELLLTTQENVLLPLYSPSREFQSFVFLRALVSPKETVWMPRCCLGWWHLQDGHAKAQLPMKAANRLTSRHTLCHHLYGVTQRCIIINAK